MVVADIVGIPAHPGELVKNLIAVTVNAVQPFVRREEGAHPARTVPVVREELIGKIAVDGAAVPACSRLTYRPGIHVLATPVERVILIPLGTGRVVPG